MLFALAAGGRDASVRQYDMLSGTRESGDCIIYISAVADIAVELADSGEKHAFACNIPSVGAALQAFLNWAERNPHVLINTGLSGEGKNEDACYRNVGRRLR